MEHKIEITTQARYFSYGNPDAKNLLVVLHGYGQLASYFIEKFRFLDPQNYFVIAPEGLHRFYTTGTSGRVGASWMTKECRETDIENYLVFLEAVIHQVCLKNEFEKKVLLGFSQGGATGSRLIGLGSIHFDAFVLWAAIFPNDMKFEGVEKFSKTKNYLVIGDQDPYYSEEAVVIELEKIKKSGMKFEHVRFAGNHTIHAQTLQKILNEI